EGAPRRVLPTLPGEARPAERLPLPRVPTRVPAGPEETDRTMSSAYVNHDASLIEDDEQIALFLAGKTVNMRLQLLADGRTATITGHIEGWAAPTIRAMEQSIQRNHGFQSVRIVALDISEARDR